MRVLTYEDFCDPQDVATFKRVKHFSMHIADIGREIAAELVDGEIGDGKRSKKEFVITERGRFRLSMGPNADNTTETAAHDRMHVKRVVMGDEQALRLFFAQHGLDDVDAYKTWLDRLKQRAEGDE